MATILEPSPCSDSMKPLTMPKMAKSRSSAFRARFMSVPDVRVVTSTSRPSGANWGQ
jgi:hypothetical protein